MSMPLEFHGESDIGLVHHRNEDSFAMFPTEEGGMALMVCDGMGGMGKGDQASAMAVEILSNHLKSTQGFPPDRMRAAISEADLKVREALCESGDGLPGSTAVMVYVLEGLAHVAWVGDSRAYLVRGGDVAERTRDHKLVEDLVDAGQITQDEAKSSALAHVVTRALGGRRSRDVTVEAAALDHPWVLQQGDRIVICSDGVCDLVEDQEVAEIVSDRSPKEAVRRLIGLSLERGGHDNTTAIVAQWTGDRVADDPEDMATPVVAGHRVAVPNVVRPDEEKTDPAVDEREVAPIVEDEDDDSEEPQPEPSKAPTADEDNSELWRIAGVILAAIVLIAAAVFAVRALFGQV